jgi:dihydroorotase
MTDKKRRECETHIKYDLLLKNGEVIDPIDAFHGRRDIAFRNGLVAAVGENIASDAANETIDVTGKLVTPGLIDIHGHFFFRYQPRFGHPDAFCLPTGVTTAVDAGSAGWSVFPALRDHVMRQCATRLLAFVHLSSSGLNKESTKQGELMNMSLIHVDETVRCIQENSEYVVGLKVRIDDTALQPEDALPALKLARQTADQAGCRTMVHVSRSPIPLAQILEFLRAGDIVTHPFHGAPNGPLDAAGKIRSEVLAARNRGILFDSGCAKVHLDLNVCRALLEQGLAPDTISTDGSRLENSYSLPDVMSIFLELGMPLEQVVDAATRSAAAAIGRIENLGSLRAGAAGDATVLDLEEGAFAFDDRAGNTLRCRRRLVALLTVRSGRRWRAPILPC